MFTSKAARQIVSEGLKEGIKLRTFHALVKFEFKPNELAPTFVPYTFTELGKVSVALKKLEDHTYQAALSFCSPKDIFNRKVGHAIAIKRLQKGKTIEFEVDDGEVIKSVIKPLIHEYAVDHNIGWMRKVSDLV